MRERIGLVGVLALAGIMGGMAWAETIPDSWQACERFAVKQYQEWSPGQRVSLTLSPVGLEEDKFENKVGSQFVSTVISGSCQLKMGDEQGVTAPCLCLLENDHKAVFFTLLENQGRQSGVE